MRRFFKHEQYITVELLKYIFQFRANTERVKGGYCDL